MTKFEIKQDFLLDGKPFKMLSGAIHYFRVHPSDWYHSLYNLKALGFNTVETYVPWNLHEPQHGTFNFQAGLDIERFLTLAKELGLYAIVRPSPYICAEWEFGGLPAWLLTEKNMRIRSSDQAYLDYVASYYDVLLPKLVKHQLNRGGNILMLQVENEYGSYGEDKAYLRAIRDLLVKHHINQPLFTSDGPWRATMRAGSLISDDILVTGNFGSQASKNFDHMQQFFNEHGKKWPLMCMEFWDGWFNRYQEPMIRRDPLETASSIRDVLRTGSINLYMFHGGTNFGFMNGASARGEQDLPQITSYDYDAPLDEQGNPTAKYDAIRKMIHSEFPDILQQEPLIKKSFAQTIELTQKVSLWSTLTKLSPAIYSKYPDTMEALRQNTGYLLYRTTLQKDDQQETLRLIDGRDRAQVFLDECHVATQYQEEIGQDIKLNLRQSASQLDVLFENMGRVNYGAKLVSATQQKGLRQGVMADLHFMTDWLQYPLSFDSTEKIDFSGEWHPNQPAFYQYIFERQTLEDTFIDVSDYGKGIAFVNGVNIGRFWEKSPVLSLYVPSGLLKKGRNEIIIFETEGKISPRLSLVTQPIYQTVSKEEKI